MMIYTKYINSPIGEIEISSNECEIVSIMFKDTQKKPSPQLPATVEITPILETCVKQLNEYFAGKRKIFDLTYKQEGTDFQQQVWNELMKIPYGRTISYNELAINLGDQKKIRAVANANGLNKLNLLVPCHRVIGSDGKLVGYGGDLWRKRWLLVHELENSDKTGRLF